VSRATTIAVLATAAALVAGCGTTEESGSVGQELTAKGLRVTVRAVDRSPPLPKQDVTGLSLPAQGFRLVGVRVHVCSNHGGAIGAYSFGIETTGDRGRLKFPARNYARPFEVVRDGCGGGWVVFEVPADTRPARVTFGFEDTGSAQPGSHNEVKARFAWNVEK
jgi:hypothetical protein